ncbi:MAG: hypothetical protein ABW007_07790, partial [Chitinophagaceae bacterium]
ESFKKNLEFNNPGEGDKFFKAIAKKFDGDGNGELDDTEQKAFDNYLAGEDTDGSGDFDGKEHKGIVHDYNSGWLGQYASTYNQQADAESTEADKVKYAYGQGNTPGMDALDYELNGDVDKKKLDAHALHDSLLEKFDEDGDGKLTGLERASAEKFLEHADTDNKGFGGSKDIKRALHELNSLTPEAVKGFRQAAEADNKDTDSDSSSKGSDDKNKTWGGGGGGGGKDFKAEDFKLPSRDELLQSLPKELRDVLDKYLPKY